MLHLRAVSLAGTSLQLDVDQRAAVALGLWQNLLIISGGPGTGKTSIVFTLLRCLTRLGIRADRIALAAPMGRTAHASAMGCKAIWLPLVSGQCPRT